LISVILYGRNDSYGYNLHKRAAISLNCIAEVLTHPKDEIIFVDCNTPDDAPSFLEAIQDTLTAKAKKLTRILRLRPHLYDKYRRGSPLYALEPLSRNVALRRSNPLNRWILSTNTDMVFIVRAPEKSLSDVVAELPDGFYELPRFEVPEALWETLNRMDPCSVMVSFREWGKRLHLNEVIKSEPIMLFDGPGDFQLMLREQIFGIHGFDEGMVLGWHVDSNLCKRLYLLNKETKSLLDHVFSYHCDHTRQATFLHTRHQRTENDRTRFFTNVTSPFLPNQAETWGIPNEEIEEVHLDAEGSHFSRVLESILPGMPVEMTFDVLRDESFNHGQLYDNLHALPFLTNHLSTIPLSSNIGYFGGNVELLNLMGDFLSKIGHKGYFFVDSDLLMSAHPGKKFDLSKQCMESDRSHILEKADIFIFDTAMMHFGKFMDQNQVSFPLPSEEADNYREKLKESFLSCVKHERIRLRNRRGLQRNFVFVSSQSTWFEVAMGEGIATVLSPFSTHVRHGFLIDSFDPLPSPIGMRDLLWESAVRMVGENIREGEKLIGPARFGMAFPGMTYPYSRTMPPDPDIRWAVIHKDLVTKIDFHFFEQIMETMKPVFANEIFIIFSSRPELIELDKDSLYYKSFLDNLNRFKVRFPPISGQ